MWIGDVDVPEDLIEAARSGNLVLFVGAGASRDAPASLPDFRQLTSEIANETNTSFEESDLRSPEFLLGRIGDAAVDVHQRVRAHIDVPGSTPNLLHEAIVDLARATGIPRVVTSNYDIHVSRVIEARNLEWREFEAPALPMGDDFEGVVYLHGSLRQEPRQLIVTDADFGRAYLRDAWAARFLERMFASYAVLFVGYSHADAVMRYLGRSLSQQSSRYVLTHKPDEALWRQLHISPVAYEVRNSSHAALGAAISRWARQLSMGLLDHRQQIAQLVTAPPSAIPEEQSYLESVVADEELVTLFTELARGKDWLMWVAARPQGRLLFDANAAPAGAPWALASWFARQCLADEELSMVGLRMISESGGQMSTSLWDAIGQQLHVIARPNTTPFGPWVALMVENAPRSGRDWLEYELAKMSLPDDRDAALLLLDYLTEPHIVVKPPFLSESVGFDIELRSDEFWLRDAWEKVFVPHLADVLRDVLAMAGQRLRHAHRLLTEAGGATRTWDPVSFRRSSITPHEQDRHRRAIDVVVDAARDCLELLVATDSASANGVISGWAESGVPLLERLAIHGVTVDESRTGAEKVLWLLDRRYLFDLLLKHEVFAPRRP